MKQKVDWLKIFIFLLVFVVAFLASILAQPLVHGNEKAIDLIVNVFSILAGFLIAVMTIFNEIKIESSSSWRSLELKKRQEKKRAFKNKLLFLCYLAVLLFVFLSILLEGSSEKVVSYFEYLYLFFATMAFIYSLFLPAHIYKERTWDLERELTHKLPSVLKPQSVKNN